MQNLTYGSVCSGIEAVSAAWHTFGWKPAWFAEIEKFPCAVLKHHYPDVPNLGDMTKLEEHDVYRRTPIDILCGGTPCQSFSIAGLRGGIKDARGNLCLTFCKIALAKRPRFVLWENVPGVLSSGGGQDFGCFLAGLSGADAPLRAPVGGWNGAGIVSGPVYGLAWRILDAQHFGVPQRRRRVFVVGYLGDWRRAARILFEPQGMPGDSAEGRQAGQGTSAATPEGPRASDEASPPQSQYKNQQELKTPTPGPKEKDGKQIKPSRLKQDTGRNPSAVQREREREREEQSVAPLTGSPGPAHPSGAKEPEDRREMNTITSSLRERERDLPLSEREGRDSGGRDQCDTSAGEHDDGRAQRPGVCSREITHTLKGEGFDGSEDGTGRWIPLVVEDSE